MGIIFGITQQVHGLIGIHHGREDGTQAILTIETLNGPLFGLLDGAVSDPLGDIGLNMKTHPIHNRKVR